MVGFLALDQLLNSMHRTSYPHYWTFINFYFVTVDLVNETGELCEKEGHHADFTLGWGYCKVIFQTHKINGLHENDFIMAAKVNELASRLDRKSVV